MRPELQHDIHRHFDDEVRVVHLQYGGLWWHYVFNLSNVHASVCVAVCICSAWVEAFSDRLTIDI